MARGRRRPSQVLLTWFDRRNLITLSVRRLCLGLQHVRRDA